MSREQAVRDGIVDALNVVNASANKARHRRDYDEANALVEARVTLYRATHPQAASSTQAATIAELNAALGAAFADDPANAVRAHAVVEPIIRRLAASSTQAADRRLALELAAQFDWWLRFNADCHAKDGTQVHDDMHVIAPEWPRRETLKVWIDLLTRLASSTTPASGGDAHEWAVKHDADTFLSMQTHDVSADWIAGWNTCRAHVIAQKYQAAAQEGAQGERA